MPCVSKTGFGFEGVTKMVGRIMLLGWLFTCLFVQYGIADIKGIYVCKKYQGSLVEFFDDGRYMGKGLSIDSGQFKLQGDKLTLVDGNQRSMKFSVRDGTLIGDDGLEWVPRKQVLKMPWADIAPVKIVAVDYLTEEPLQSFGFSYSIGDDQHDFSPLLVRDIEVKSKDGQFVLDAPKSCVIWLEFSGDNVVSGYGLSRTVVVRSDDKKREFTVPVATGSIAKGVITDSETKEPIAGASISPIMFTPPLFTPDKTRAVKTNDRGEYRLAGMDEHLGIAIEHPEYQGYKSQAFGLEGKQIGKGVYAKSIELTPRATREVTGVVVDQLGHPIPDVRIQTYGDLFAISDSNGKITIRGHDLLAMRTEKEGYLERDFSFLTFVDNPRIELKKMPVLNITVVGIDDRPVTEYRVGSGSGSMPEDFYGIDEISNANGKTTRFINTKRDYDDEKVVFVGVTAPGYKPWHTVLDVWSGQKEMTIKLKQGPQLTGSIKCAKELLEGAKALIRPIANDENEKQDELLSIAGNISMQRRLSEREVDVAADGGFTINHIAPGSYWLVIHGPKISPIRSIVEVDTMGKVLEPIRVLGRGSISGIVQYKEGDNEENPQAEPLVFYPGSVSFEDGGEDTDEVWEHLEGVQFRTDENGRFKIDGVPAGNVKVVFNYHLTADIISAWTKEAQVEANQNTEVRIFADATEGK